jgi:hypothetical protein
MRRLTMAVIGLLYLMSVAVFWLAGILAYFFHFGGPARLAGILFFPILALPFVGRGTIAGFEVASFFWWGWFALQLVLAGSMLLLAWWSNARRAGGSASPSPSRTRDAVRGDLQELGESPSP